MCLIMQLFCLVYGRTFELAACCYCFRHFRSAIFSEEYQVDILKESLLRNPEWVDQWMVRWMDGWMNGWIYPWIDALLGGWMGR